eukprot:365314-Chlamydomonas_euryale.AAC.10
MPVHMRGRPCIDTWAGSWWATAHKHGARSNRVCPHPASGQAEGENNLIMQQCSNGSTPNCIVLRHVKPCRPSAPFHQAAHKGSMPGANADAQFANTHIATSPMSPHSKAANLAYAPRFPTQNRHSH